SCTSRSGRVHDATARGRAQGARRVALFRGSPVCYRAQMSRHTAVVALTALAALSACATDNQPPSLALTLDQQVTVGESLRLVLVASDPDGDRLDFAASGLPAGAQITPRSATE